MEARAGLRRRRARVHPDAPDDARHGGPGPPGPDPHGGSGARQLPAALAVLRRRPALRDGGPRHWSWPPPGTRDDPAATPAASWRRRMSTGSSPDLGPAGPGVVRLNRRVIY